MTAPKTTAHELAGSLMIYVTREGGFTEKNVRRVVNAHCAILPVQAREQIVADLLSRPR